MKESRKGQLFGMIVFFIILLWIAFFVYRERMAGRLSN
jgi:cbb3-type cytochrome oxidase subunit 3